MMKRQVKIAFTGFPPYHDPHQQAYFRFLADRYELVECDKPDFVIDGGQNFRHMRHEAVKIELNSENLAPDFNLYDYAVGSTPLEFGERYVRIPWFAFSPHLAELDRRGEGSDGELLDRKFCSFVVSNAEFADPLRRRFFEALSRYKRVDAGGKYLNNVGAPVADKLAFCRGYKFNLAFENSACPGYTTEKIVDAYAAHSLPVYYGNPEVERDFRPESMIRVAGEADIERVVEEIVRLDRDDAAYLKAVRAPCLVESSGAVYEERLERFLAAILDQEPAAARRRCPYGQQAVMQRHLKLVYGCDQFLRDFPGYNLAVGILGRLRCRRRGL